MPDLLDRLKTALTDRYAIEEELGAGGMATVYLAEDLKNHRQVAVKVLRPELAAAIGPERFLREIEIAANLTHPHILPLFDSGEADGFLYYAMPYIEGESLRDRLVHDKQLPLDDAIEITRQVARALGYAHDRNVVHRDIKPENILLAEGVAVVADFGIAKAIHSAGGDALTQTGMSVGTPSYMSPEQAGGTGDLDGRSDIYSLGCVLYEMLAGEPPFTGPTAQSVVHQHMTAEAPSVTVIRDHVPREIAEAVDRALAKTPADRFRTAQDLGAALTAPPSVAAPMGRGARAGATPSRWSTRVVGMAVAAAVIVVAAVIFALRPGETAADLDPDAVVVLPFRVSGDASLEYLREGMLDLLHAKLTGEGIPRAVDPRTVLSAWRRVRSDDSGDLAVEASLDVARGVNAGQLLLGSIVGIGADVTMSGELRRVPDGDILARASVTTRGDSLIPLTDRFVAQILSRLGREREERVGDLTTRSWPAVRAYLAAQQLYRRGRYEEARDRFGEALDIDSTFALAALGRRTASLLAGQSREDSERAWALRDRLSNRDRAYLEALFNPGGRSERQAIIAAQAAVDLAPDHLEALGRLGYWLLSRGLYVDWPAWQDGAREAFDHAIAIDSSYTYAVEMRLRVAFLTGDTTHVRRLSDLLWASDSTRQAAGYYRWRAARELGDSAVVRAVRARFAELGNLGLVVNFTILDGLTAEDAERAAAAMLERANTTSQRISAMEVGRGTLLVAQGRVRAAAAVFDSTLRLGHGDAAEHLLRLALMEPGYDSAAAAVVEHFDEARIESSNFRVLYICERELWRIEHGDTSTAAGTLHRLTTLVSELNLNTVCPLLLEATLEFSDATRTSWPAFERLDSLMREGSANDGASGVANLYIARWREAQGDRVAALAAVRRRLYRSNYNQTMALAAYLRREGELAVAVGDIAGAIRAYDHYLRLRTAPDPGPMQEEVERVRVELTRLVGEGRRD